MITAIVTRVPESDGTPGLRWAVILVSQPQRRARVIRKSDYFGGSVHDWARAVAKRNRANFIAWDSGVILSQRFRGRKCKWHPARN